jgi:ribosome-associated translation inhibitor RaiA
MKIQLNTDSNIVASEGLTVKINAMVEKELKHFAEHITRVEVHLRDENAGKNGPHDQRCMLEARLEGRPPVAVTEHAATLEQAVSGAAHQLARMLDSKLGKLQNHREKASSKLMLDTEPEQ